MDESVINTQYIPKGESDMAVNIKTLASNEKQNRHNLDSFYVLSNFIEGKTKKKRSDKLIINH